ncbi:MAG: FISUMP domain-containing protein [Paludibacter sp.]|nr:FISUMP domain-containing protein [Paludibacter sp.]
MKKNVFHLISCTLFIFLLSGCDKGADINQNNSGNLDFSIDSIYNLTQTSVTIKATLTTQGIDKIITGLHVEYYKENGDKLVNGIKKQSFDQKEGTVVMTITNLEPNTVYYITPWTDLTPGSNHYVEYINDMTAPTKEVSFMTHGELPKTGTVKDFDGNMYHYITIGTQTWMVENLKTKHLRSGLQLNNLKDSISRTNTEFGYCYYNNDTTYYNKYGCIYSRGVANSYIAPGGWHVPTMKDWFTLESYLIANGYNYDKSTHNNGIAKSLASQTNDWKSDYHNTGCITSNLTLNNSSGFTALPEGNRNNNGMYSDVGSSCYFWSLSQNSQLINCMILFSVSSSTYDVESFDVNGMYIRCIRDNN